eukprot:1192954-Prorocentrum_minimum.AAC.5
MLSAIAGVAAIDSSGSSHSIRCGAWVVVLLVARRAGVPQWRDVRPPRGGALPVQTRAAAAGGGAEDLRGARWDELQGPSDGDLQRLHKNGTLAHPKHASQHETGITTLGKHHNMRQALQHLASGRAAWLAHAISQIALACFPDSQRGGVTPSQQLAALSTRALVG